MESQPKLSSSALSASPGLIQWNYEKSVFFDKISYDRQENIFPA
jgi:hypothetical protein